MTTTSLIAKLQAANVPAPPQLSNYWQDRFGECENLAKQADEKDLGAREALRNALVRLYEFVEELRKSPRELRDFIVSKGKPWNKVTRENPYNAIGQMLFPHRAKSRVSTYAKALKHAHSVGLSPDTLRMQLGSQGKGVERLAGYTSSQESEAQKEPRREMLPEAKSKLRNAPDLQEDVEFRTIGGFAEVLLHVNPDGTFRIIDILEADPERMDERLLRYCNLPGGRFDKLRYALRLAKLIPFDDTVPRVISLYVAGDQLHVRAQGCPGLLLTAIIPSIDGLPAGKWLSFLAAEYKEGRDWKKADFAARLIRLIDDIADNAELSSEDTILGDEVPGVQLAFSGQDYTKRITAMVDQPAGTAVHQLKTDQELNLTFDVLVTAKERERLLASAGHHRQAGIRRVTLSDGRELSNSKASRIELYTQHGQLFVKFADAEGLSSLESLAGQNRAQAANDGAPLKLAADELFKPIALLHRMAGGADLRLKGNAGFVELSLEHDGGRYSFAVADPNELDRSTSPYLKLRLDDVTPAPVAETTI